MQICKLFCIIAYHMTRRTNSVLYAALNKSTKLSGMKQVEIARATGIHQSQISRMMSGNFRRVTARNLAKLCKYADVVRSAQRHISPLLKKTLEALWDGSPEQEQALVRLLKAAEMLALTHAASANASVRTKT